MMHVLKEALCICSDHQLVLEMSCVFIFFNSSFRFSEDLKCTYENVGLECPGWIKLSKINNPFVGANCGDGLNQPLQRHTRHCCRSTLWVFVCHFILAFYRYLKGFKHIWKNKKQQKDVYCLG